MIRLSDLISLESIKLCFREVICEQISPLLQSKVQFSMLTKVILKFGLPLINIS